MSYFPRDVVFKSFKRFIELLRFYKRNGLAGTIKDVKTNRNKYPIDLRGWVLFSYRSYIFYHNEK